MNILHVISSIDISEGGPSKSVSDLAVNQARQGAMVTILTRKSKIPYIEKSPHLNLIIVFLKNMDRKSIKDYLDKNKIDILHGHGLWQMPVHNMAKVGREWDIPYVITPRGMLEPWALNKGKWKKKLALITFQKKDLARAACVHATAEMEASQFRKLGFKNSIAVIPNGIDLNEFPRQKPEKKKLKKTLLFLSRIHPKKGIEILIQAWGKLERNIIQNWNIEIAGNGEEGYVKSLQELIKNNGLTDSIKIIGPQYGSAKIAAYERADLFVLPTYSENFGIVVAEALACNTPVITTKGTPWQELETSKSGWWIDIGVEPLKKALEHALQTPNEILIQMGENGRILIEEKYSIGAVAEKMLKLYDRLLKAKGGVVIKERD